MRMYCGEFLSHASKEGCRHACSAIGGLAAVVLVTTILIVAFRVKISCHQRIKLANQSGLVLIVGIAT